MTAWNAGDFIQQNTEPLGLYRDPAPSWHFLILKRRFLDDKRGNIELVELVMLTEDGKIETEFFAENELANREAHTDSSDPRISYYGFTWKVLYREGRE